MTVLCALSGHHVWDGYGEKTARCKRCGRYEDDPAVERSRNRRNALRRWSPIWPSVSRRDLRLRLGWERPALNLSGRLRVGFNRTDELPGLVVWLHVWRLNISAGLGFGWMDEDGDGRTFANFRATFTTYGLRWIGCWFGHKPESLWTSHVSCARCDASLEETAEGA